MSTKLSLKEALGRRGKTGAESQSPSDTPKVRLLLSAVQIARPVAVARFLFDRGLSLKKAHNVLERIAAGRTVPVELAGDPHAAVSALARLGVSAALIQPPEVDLKQVREALELTQSEFATLYDIELDTLQNWEQGRNVPDKGTMHFYKFIEAFPDLSMKLMTGGLSGVQQGNKQKDKASSSSS